MRVMFGRRFEDIIATAFMQPDHDTSYQNVTFAERDTDIVGMILAIPLTAFLVVFWRLAKEKWVRELV